MSFDLTRFYRILAFRAWQRGQWELMQELIKIAAQVAER